MYGMPTLGATSTGSYYTTSGSSWYTTTATTSGGGWIVVRVVGHAGSDGRDDTKKTVDHSKLTLSQIVW